MFRYFRHCFFILVVVAVISIILGLYLVSKVSTRLDSAFGRFFRHQEPAAEVVPRPEKTVRIIEGASDHDIATALEQAGLIGQSAFDEAVKAGYSSSTYPFLADKPAKADLEGYLYPDTYRFYASTTATEIIGKMLDNFGSKVTPQMMSDVRSQGKSLYQVLIMASIIEKEAAIDYRSGGDNRTARIISGIFWKRIKNGERLQSCATLAYALGINKAQYSEADTQVDSPYNTYRRDGLPPTPISNPGIEAIEAAIYPISSDYNYFLTPKDSKDIVFAKTYEEHLRNKARYL